MNFQQAATILKVWLVCLISFLNSSGYLFNYGKSNVFTSIFAPLAN